MLNLVVVIRYYNLIFSCFKTFGNIVLRKRFKKLIFLIMVESYILSSGCYLILALLQVNLQHKMILASMRERRWWAIMFSNLVINGSLLRSKYKDKQQFHNSFCWTDTHIWALLLTRIATSRPNWWYLVFQYHQLHRNLKMEDIQAYSYKHHKMKL